MPGEKKQRSNRPRKLVMPPEAVNAAATGNLKDMKRCDEMALQPCMTPATRGHAPARDLANERVVRARARVLLSFEDSQAIARERAEAQDVHVSQDDGRRHGAARGCA